MSDTISVLIVDDHQIVREGLRLILETAEGVDVAGEAADGAEALRLVSELNPNVVLMDLRMEGMDGLTAIERLQQDYPQVSVVILTTYNEDELMLRGLRAGAGVIYSKIRVVRPCWTPSRRQPVAKLYSHPQLLTASWPIQPAMSLLCLHPARST